MDWVQIATSLGLSIAVLKKIVKKFIGNTRQQQSQININIENSNILISKGSGDVINNAEILFQTKKFGMMREEMMASALTMQVESLAHQDDLALLDKVLTPMDYSAIVIVYTVIRLDNAGNSDESREVYHQLISKHKERGRRIYNLMRGGYFEDIIFDVKWEMMFCGARPEAIKDKIQRRFNKIVETSDVAIFVNEYTFPFMLIESINKKLIEKGKVNIHFREPYYSIVEDSLEMVKKDFPKLKIEKKEDGSIGDRTAYIYTVTKNSD